jgi:subtilisin family serine protease
MPPRRTRLAALTALATGAVLAMAPTAAVSQPADQPTHRAGGADGLAPVHGKSAANRYIVVFEKGASDQSVNSARDDARMKGATVHHTYRAALDGFSATLPAAALRGLRNNPRVAFIEADAEVRADDTQSPATWGIDRIDQRNLPLNNSYTYTQSGQGVTAYVIDTGIRRTHAEFSGRAVSGYTAINDGQGTNDCNGHGTHVAGTVGGETYGVAQDVRLVAVRVLGCDGSGTNSGVIAGIDWVTSNHSAGTPAVANMSLGGGASSAVDTAVNNSISDGVAYAVAAGNDYGANACNGSPSRVPAALTVGSTTSTDARSSFSNIGSCLDLFAPGSSITSAWMTSDTATNTISGTSMATPHVAGVAALYLQANPGASPSAVGSAIVSSATPGVVGNPGSGSPNRLLYSNVTGGGTEPPPTGCAAMPEKVTGSLSGSGDLDYHPGSSGYWNAPAGTHHGCLDGPAGVDFDLYLEKWNGSAWVVVAQGISSSADENVTYSGTAGYYSWRVESYSGSGSYTFGFDRP